MCGRFALRLAHNEIRQIPGHDIHVAEWIDEDDFVPRYNIAPRTQAPVLRRNTVIDHSAPDTSCASTIQPGSQADAPHYILQTMKWGLVPHWSKIEDKTLSTTNARSENLTEGGGMWASIKGKKRCAVVCQGYYEWLSKGKDKLPHFTKHRDGQVMLMAGLYDCAFIEGQEGPLWSFTIVTTQANKEFSWLHDRQPVILSTRAALDAWLDTSQQIWTVEINKLVRPYHDATNPLECYQVPKEVGKVGTESPRFIEPIANRKDGIQAMFSKQTAKSDFPATPNKGPFRMKRLRSSSPTQDQDLVSFLPPKKEQKASGVDRPLNTKIKPEHSPRPLKLSPKKLKSQGSDPSNTKLTSFFRKV